MHLLTNAEYAGVSFCKKRACTGCRPSSWFKLYCRSRGRRATSRDLAVLGDYNVNACAADAFNDDITDRQRSLCADLVDLLHALEDLILGEARVGLDTGPLLGAAYDHNCGGNCALRMCDFLAGVFVADRAGIAFYAEDFLALELNSDLAAHGAADTCKISLFHFLSLL